MSYITISECERRVEMINDEVNCRLNARALVTVGKEWRSLPVWKEVIAFETSIGNPLVRRRKREGERGGT